VRTSQNSHALIAARFLYGDVKSAGCSCEAIFVRIVALRDLKMAKVNVILKLMPEDPERGFNKTIEQIREKSKELNYVFKDYREEEIAFGIKNLYISIVIKETGGLIDRIEKEFLKLDNVGNLEVIGVSRV